MKGELITKTLFILIAFIVFGPVQGMAYEVDAEEIRNYDTSHLLIWRVICDNGVKVSVVESLDADGAHSIYGNLLETGRYLTWEASEDKKRGENSIIDPDLSLEKSSAVLCGEAPLPDEED